jgi:glyoxylase-like metal-dependent hydrolase (beta-lactamase superfamily II)
VCFLFRSTGVLFSGDTLFAGSVGRTDLPGGNARRLAASLRKFSTLSSVTRVLCGHGPETTLGRERRVNFFLQHLNPEGAHA